MRELGRPTDEELDRIEELADEYFRSDRWAVEVRCWDDGDVHLIAYSTLGTNVSEGYPIDVRSHKQLIIYERESGHAHYQNKVNYQTNMKPDKLLNRIEIDF